MLRHLLSLIHVLTLNGSIYCEILYDNKANCHWKRTKIIWNWFNWTFLGEEIFLNSPSDAYRCGYLLLSARMLQSIFKIKSKHVANYIVYDARDHHHLLYKHAKFARPMKCTNQNKRIRIPMRMFCRRAAALNRVRMHCTVHIHKKIGRKR